VKVDFKKAPNVGIVVTARVKSSRIPNKVLQQINGRTTIEILLDHVINDKYSVILAIPEAEENNPLAEIGNRKGIEVYRGEDDSPLHRLYEVATQNGLEHVVRVTADDILIDKTLMLNQIQFHVRGGQDYTFMRKCPEGIATEIISVPTLEKVVREVGKKPVEFISYYVKRASDIKEYYPPREYQWSFRLVMDYIEDLMLLRVLFASLPEPIGTLDIVNFLKAHKYFLNINRLPEVTVYTCNFNTSKYITDCMDSVIGQTFQDFEYIVLDDHSTDDSMDIITEYHTKLPWDKQAKMKIMRNPENIGLATSCNRLLEIARGKYIIRVDSDDTMAPGALAKMVETAKLNDAAAVLSGYYETEEFLTVTAEEINNMWHPGCSLLLRGAANEVKFRDDLKYLEGAEFFARFRKAYKTEFVPECLWYYRRRPGQKTADPEHPENGGVA